MKPDVYKVRKIGNGFLAAMAKPVPGEFIEEEFAGIANEGVNQIVSLLEKHEEYTVGLEIYQQISEGINTVVHCRAGIGRTGMVTAGILLHDGMAPEEAFELISEKRGITVPDTEEQRQWVISNHKDILL